MRKRNIISIPHVLSKLYI